MRILFLFLSVLGTVPVGILVLLTFLSFPQWSDFTEKLTGREPELVHFYSASKSIAGMRISIQFVPRTLSEKLAPTIMLLTGIVVQLLGVLWYLYTRTE